LWHSLFGRGFFTIPIKVFVPIVSTFHFESDIHMNRIKSNHDDIGAVMVVGGGIAGIQASLDLADLGYYVYMVEKSASVGGVMAQLDKTFPTNDCAI
jgi:NAD(P)H-nitrite reductase large subunit